MSNNYRYEYIETDEKSPVRFDFSIDDEYRRILQHWHDEIEIIFLLAGQLDIQINNQHYTVEAGQIVTINSNFIHTTQSVHPDTKAYVLQIPFSMIKQCHPDAAELLFDTLNIQDETAFQLLKQDFHLLNEAYNDDYEHIHIRIKALIYDIIYLLIRRFSLHAEAGSSDMTGKHISRLADITNYIDEHYQEVISLKSTARQMGLSYEYLSRFFKKHIGITFTNYVDLVRLEHAWQEILFTDHAITNIAGQCGFASYQAFQRKFKEHYGLNPLAFRKEFRSKPEAKRHHYRPSIVHQLENGKSSF